MKIAVIQPPIRDFYQTPHRHAALGCFSVKALLEKAGHEVKLFNFPLLGGKQSTPPLPKELQYLKPYLMVGETGPVSWFQQRKHFGPSFEECARLIAEWEPDRMMISCFAWCYAEEARLLAIELKKRSPGIPLEIGGPGVSVFPQWFEKSGLFDQIRTGPAEENLKDFPGMPGTLPDITPVLSQVAPYRNRPQFSTMLTRGCPSRCRFCANHLTLGRRFRKLSAGTMLDMIKQTGQTIFHLNLEDDNLLADQAYFLDFLERFHQTFPQATLSAENGLDYQKLTIPLAERMIEKGFIRFNLSMASSDEQILSAQNRNSRLDHLEGLLAYLQSRAIPSVSYFICGLSGDTPESVCRNLLYLADQPTEIGISPFYAVPGLPGFEGTEERKRPEYPGLYCGSSVYPWNGNLTTSQMITAFRLSRWINLKKSPAQSRWADLIKMIEKTGRLHTLINKGKKQSIREVPDMDGAMVSRILKGGI